MQQTDRGHTRVWPAERLPAGAFAGSLFDLAPADTRDPILKLYEDEWRPANQAILALFRRYAAEVYHAGRTTYGCRAVAERVRWHVFVESRGAGDDFKINDHYIPLIARDLMTEGTVPDGFFETRVRGADRHAERS